MSLYADNENINPEIRGIGITGDNDNGEYNLVIYNFNKSNEGNYKCSTVQNGTAVQHNFELTLEHGMYTYVYLRIQVFYSWEKSANIHHVYNGNEQSVIGCTL